MPHSSQDVRNKILGRKGEKLTRRYLRLHGYKIIARNYVTPFGEADIVAQKGEIYCFVEVKARTGDVLALPSEAVNRAKQARYKKIALYFCTARGEEVPVRFDVASVLDGRLEYFENAYE